jgi:ribosomal protein S27E
VPLITCQSCGKTSFTFARRAYVAHCGGCGKPLGGTDDTSAIELEIRERLYGQKQDVTRSDVAPRG